MRRLSYALISFEERVRSFIDVVEFAKCERMKKN